MPWKAEGSTGNKQNLNLSADAFTVMQMDELAFIGKENHSRFVSTVFENYRDRVNDEVRQEQQRRREALNAKEEPTMSEKRRQEKLRKLEDQYRNELSKAYPRDVPKKISLQQKAFDYLYENCPEQELYKNPSDYLKIVLERYARLDVGQREKVFFDKTVRKLEGACSKKCCVDITMESTKGQRRFSVRPYGIVQSRILPYYYLIGMSQEIGSKKPEAAASFRLCRITDVHENATKNGSLTALEKNRLKEKLQENDAAYLLESREEVVVRLTQQGEKLLANKQFQRPAPFEKEADGIYRFKCSANQASNYFSSFGANAVILEPKRLRDRMRKMYEDAFLRYQQETEEENKKPRTAGQPDARGE